MNHYASVTKGLLPLCAATLFILSCSCGQDPVPSTSEVTLSVNPSSVDAGYEAQTLVLTVTATGDWGVSAADKDWCSVHTVLEEKRFWEIIGQLKAAGAQGILVLPIEKMIL